MEVSFTVSGKLHLVVMRFDYSDAAAIVLVVMDWWKKEPGYGTMDRKRKAAKMTRCTIP